MMPSRGLTPLAGSLRSFAPSARASPRFVSFKDAHMTGRVLMFMKLSTAVPRQHPRTALRPQILSQRLAVQKRNLSLSPSSWFGGSPSSSTTSNSATAQSAAENAPVTASHLAPANATSGATPTPSSHESLPLSSTTPANSSDIASDIANINLDTIQNGGHYPLATMPEHIGFMKELGIEYGWGLTSSLEWFLEHVHVYSGMPWWASIIATAFCTRLVLFPLFIKSSDTTARMGAIQHLIKPKMEEMQQAASNNDNQTAMRLRGEIASMFGRAGVSFKMLFLPMALQMYMAICALRLMRAASNLPVPGFVDGGALWFMDLTVADPYLGLPAIMALTIHMVFRFGGESGAQMMETAALLRPLLLYIMPVGVFISMAWFPAGVNLWLATTGLFGVVQARLLQNPTAREFFGLAPMIKPTPKPKPVVDVKNVKSVSARKAAGNMQYQAPNMPSSSAGQTPIAEETPAPGFITSKVNDVSNGVTNWINDAKETRDKWLKNREGKVHPRGSEYQRRAEEYERQFRQKGRQ